MGNGKENGREVENFLAQLGNKPDQIPPSCALEGIEERPNECPNNPWRHPDNHRPKICQQCPGDPEIWKVARSPLSPIHIKTKQAGEIIFPKPKNP